MHQELGDGHDSQAHRLGGKKRPLYTGTESPDTAFGRLDERNRRAEEEGPRQAEDIPKSRQV